MSRLPLFSLLLFLPSAFPVQAQQQPAAPAVPQAPATKELPPPAKVLTPKDGPQISYKSILFRPEEIQKVNDSIQERIRRQSRVAEPQDFITALQVVPKTVTATVVHPYFYLAAIIYHTPADWIVWLNNVKYTSREPGADNIRILSVTPRAVEIEWRPPDIRVYLSRAPEDPLHTMIDGAENVIRFSLAPNQSFSSFDLAVTEGMLVGEKTEQVTTTENVTVPVRVPAPATPPKEPVNPVSPANATKAASNPAAELGLPTAPLPSLPTFIMEKK